MIGRSDDSEGAYGSRVAWAPPKNGHCFSIACTPSQMLARRHEIRLDRDRNRRSVSGSSQNVCGDAEGVSGYPGDRPD